MPGLALPPTGSCWEHSEEEGAGAGEPRGAAAAAGQEEPSKRRWPKVPLPSAPTSRPGVLPGAGASSAFAAAGPAMQHCGLVVRQEISWQVECGLKKAR